MFLTHCVIVLTVLSLCLPVWSAVNVRQQYRVDSTDGTAKVQCLVQPQPSYHQQETYDDTLPYPYPDPEEIRVTLLKGLHGTQELCSSILNFTGQREADRKREAHVQCYVQVKEGAVEVMVSGLKATDTDIYRCEIEVFYPPPYLRLMGNGTLIHVLGSSDCSGHNAERQITQQSDEEDDDEDDERRVPFSLPVIMLVSLVIFVLIIIIYYQALQCAQGRRDTVRPVIVENVLHKADAAVFSCENV